MQNKNSKYLPSFIRVTADGINITVKAKPGAKRNSISLESQEYLKVSISAPPVDGKANIELVKFFSDIFDIPKSSVQLLRGGSSKNKVVSLKGVTVKDFYNKTAKFAFK